MTNRIPRRVGRHAFLTVSAFWFAGLACSPAGPSPDDGIWAHIHTNRGTIVARLDPHRTPMTVTNFVGLAEGTLENAASDPGVPFYDGTPFHRVVPGHVIQAGVAMSDRAPGPGYTFPNELHAELSHDRAGMLNMANGGPHTNSAQFTITLGDRSYLDGDYIVFGEVVSGLDVVMSIRQGDVIDSLRIQRVGPEAEAFQADTRSFFTLREEALRQVVIHDSLKAQAEQAWLQERWPGAEPLGSEVVVLEGEVGEAGAAAVPTPTMIRYQGLQIRYRGQMVGYSGPSLEETAFVSQASGAPGPGETPALFALSSPGSGSNPALDSILPLLAPGTRLTMAVPSRWGYGQSGFYPPEVPGQPRFIISPGALLIYEIEALDPSGE
ncbi:MAG: peptidylprolyl isomerase [Gemmatimonadota bacterium]